MRATLCSSVEELLDAATATIALLSNADSVEVYAQAREAVELARQVALADKPVAETLSLLHDLNNRLTGALSIAGLAREELGATNPSASAALALVEERARRSADIAKQLGVLLNAIRRRDP